MIDFLLFLSFHSRRSGLRGYYDGKKLQCGDTPPSSLRFPFLLVGRGQAFLCVMRREDFSLLFSSFSFSHPFCFYRWFKQCRTQTALMMKKRKGKLLIPEDIGFVTS